MFHSASRRPFGLFLPAVLLMLTPLHGDERSGSNPDRELVRLLKSRGFTGRVEQSLESRLERRVNPELADLVRNLFFDKILSLNGDNACAGCHAPSIALLAGSTTQ